MVSEFKQVFGMGVFSRRVTSAVPFCFTVPSVMPEDEPSGVGPEVQEVIKQAFSNLSAILTTVIESRFRNFKWDLVEEGDSLVASVVRRVKRSEFEF